MSIDALQHLRETFEHNCRAFPDIMEPYAVRMADVTDEGELKSLMRRALAETINARYPLKQIRRGAE